MPAIERLDPDDWARARALRLRALRDTPDAFWVTADEEAATTAPQWRLRLARSDAATFVASHDGNDVGLAVGAPHHEQRTDAGLYSLWVAPEARGGGVASALVQAVIAWARNAGYRTLRLDVGDANKLAAHLYERMGFVPTGAVGAMPAPRAHLREHELALDLKSSS